MLNMLSSYGMAGRYDARSRRFTCAAADSPRVLCTKIADTGLNVRIDAFEYYSASPGCAEHTAASWAENPERCGAPQGIDASPFSCSRGH